MIKKCLTILCISMTLLMSCTVPQHDNENKNIDAASYVDPFIGTGGHGHTFPGATAPFGMIQLSPDTRMDSWDGCSGYHISDSIILGFSHTHLSGTGVNDYGDFRFMPTTGKRYLKSGYNENKGYKSSFRHETETARPGYYSVTLDDYDIKVELTSGERVAMHRYHFPETDNAHVILDMKESTLSSEQILDAYINILNDYTVTGFRRTKQWAQDQYLYFYAEFSKPFTGYGICNNGMKKNGYRHVEGDDIQAWFDFDTNDGEPVIIRIATSAVDIDGAKNNLKTELDTIGFDFDALASVTYNKWNEELNKIVVESDNEKDMTILYSSLYHCFIAPNLYSDADGRYRGNDLEIHQSDRPIYTVFSLWDTFRAQHPLLNIIQQKRNIDFINTFIDNYEKGGILPVWGLAANETFCMIGYHAIPVIADAYINGVTGFDTEKALEAMIHSAELDHFGLNCYKQYGYIPADCEGESVSKTLEYAYDDWCIAVMAEKMGKNDIADGYYKRAQYYKNLYDNETQFFRGRINGGFVTPFDPTQVNFMLTEANTWQYNFFVPQDINGHIALMGGDAAYEKKLTELFSTSSEMTGRQQADITGLIGQYAHGNEPSHHMAYLFNFLGKPTMTQKLIHKIMDELYSDKPDGLCGNEDCGQMSAWYVMSAMGFYPVTPASGYYVIGVPHFKKMTVNLENGNSLVITADNLSRENRFIESVRLNGKKLKRSYIYFDEIMNGGTLEFIMTNQRDTQWATRKQDCPTINIKGDDIITSPVISVPAYVFYDALVVSISHHDSTVAVRYTIDGSEPTTESELYTTPFIIDKTTDVKAVAVKNGITSKVSLGSFKKIPAGRTIFIENPYNNQYEAGGDIALIDLQRGSNNFRTGTWQGYYGVDVIVTVDLGEEQELHRLAGSFLQDQNSWIFMPSKVEYFISDNGKHFKSVGSVKNNVPTETDGGITKEFELRKDMKARYVKMIAKNIKTCPDWHPGAGEKAWIFCDEFIIE